MHPTGEASRGLEEKCCLDISKTLMLPGFAYFFLLFFNFLFLINLIYFNFFFWQKTCQSKCCRVFWDANSVCVPASLENPAVGLQAHLCLPHLQTNSWSGCKKDWTTQLLQLLYKQARCECHLSSFEYLCTCSWRRKRSVSSDIFIHFPGIYNSWSQDGRTGLNLITPVLWKLKPAALIYPLSRTSHYMKWEKEAHISKECLAVRKYIYQNKIKEI